MSSFIKGEQWERRGRGTVSSFIKGEQWERRGRGTVSSFIKGGTVGEEGERHCEQLYQGGTVGGRRGRGTVSSFIKGGGSSDASLSTTHDLWVKNTVPPVLGPPRWPSGKASASRAEDPRFESRWRWDFFGVESYQ